MIITNSSIAGRAFWSSLFLFSAIPTITRSVPDDRPRTSRSNFAARLFELGEVVLQDDNAFTRRGRWREFFRDRIGSTFDEKVILEIGCANADFLTRIAQQHPTSAFIGLDWKYKSIHDAATRANQLALKNLAFIRGRGQDIAKIFSSRELDEVWLFHPDPSDKPKELANRIINDEFMIDLHESMRTKSSFCFKTDHAGYYQWMLALLGIESPKWFFEKVEGAPKIRQGDLHESKSLPEESKVILDRFQLIHHSADFWNDPHALARADKHAFARTSTPFENRFIKKNLPIYFLELIAR